MVMTLREMERYVGSEVDNLHLRVDILADVISKLETRFDRLEHRFDLMQLSLDELIGEVTYIKQNFATKEDLEQFATKEDLAGFATKEDLKQFATKTDLENFVTKDYLENRLEDLFHRLVQVLRPV